MNKQFFTTIILTLKIPDCFKCLIFKKTKSPRESLYLRTVIHTFIVYNNQEI